MYPALIFIFLVFIACTMCYVLSLQLLLMIFFVFSQKELKYRHEVVSVEQINKKIGIQ